MNIIPNKKYGHDKKQEKQLYSSCETTISVRVGTWMAFPADRKTAETKQHKKL